MIFEREKKRKEKRHHFSWQWQLGTRIQSLAQWRDFSLSYVKFVLCPWLTPSLYDLMPEYVEPTFFAIKPFYREWIIAHLIRDQSVQYYFNLSDLTWNSYALVMPSNRKLGHYKYAFGAALTAMLSLEESQRNGEQTLKIKFLKSRKWYIHIYVYTVHVYIGQCIWVTSWSYKHFSFTSNRRKTNRVIVESCFIRE